MDKIAVLLPCYNEEATIGKVIKDFHKELPEATIYVYDNNSSDKTSEIATGLADECNVVVRYETKQGKGNVIRRMFREIDADCYIMADGDDTYPAEHSREMVDKVLEDNVDMVVGDRLSSTYFEENKRPFHNFGNSIVKASINRLFKSEIKDIMTGYRAFSYNFVKTFPVLSEGFEIETEMTIHAVDKNMAVANTVIDYRDRPEGSESKLNTYGDGIKVLFTIMKLFRIYKPFRFYGMISLLMALVSTGFMIPVLYEFAKTGTVERFPTLIVCGVVYLAALLSLFCGLILDNLKQKQRQDFEFKLMAIANRYKILKITLGN